MTGHPKKTEISRVFRLFPVIMPTLKSRNLPRPFLRDGGLFPAQFLTLAGAIPPVGMRSVSLHPEVNGRKTVLHTTSSFFATIPLKNNHMGGFHDHDRQNT